MCRQYLGTICRRGASGVAGAGGSRAPLSRGGLKVGIRFRHIPLTPLTTIVGLVPMTLALGVGTQANQPLTIAVLGGLSVSPFFTRVLIPTLSVILEERFPRRQSIEEPAVASAPGIRQAHGA